MSEPARTSQEPPTDTLDTPERPAECSPAVTEQGQAGEPGAEAADPAGQQGALVRLGSEIAAVRALVEERLRYDTTKEEAFQRLYEDLEQFRGESSFVQTRPLYLDLVLLLDRLHASVEPWRQRFPETADFLLSVEDEVEEILARRGIVPLSMSDGQFDPARQRAIQIEETLDPEEHNSVARVVRRGYEWNDRLLRAEEVIVRRLRDRRRAG